MWMFELGVAPNAGRCWSKPKGQSETQSLLHGGEIWAKSDNDTDLHQGHWRLRGVSLVTVKGAQLNNRRSSGRFIFSVRDGTDSSGRDGQGRGRSHVRQDRSPSARESAIVVTGTVRADERAGAGSK
jgi:hypothetical protein